MLPFPLRLKVQFMQLNNNKAPLQGQYQEKPKLPFVPGAECSGTVVEVGRDVRTLQVGDKVRLSCWARIEGCGALRAVPVKFGAAKGCRIVPPAGRLGAGAHPLRCCGARLFASRAIIVPSCFACASAIHSAAHLSSVPHACCSYRLHPSCPPPLYIHTRTHSAPQVCAVTQGGAFAEEAVARENLVVKLPPGCDLEAAAGLPVAFGTAYLALRDRADLQPGPPGSRAARHDGGCS